VPIVFMSWEGVALYLCVSAVLLANMLGDIPWAPIEWLTRYVPPPPHLAMANLAVFAWLGWFAIRASSVSAPAAASSPASAGETADSRRRGRRRAGG
jgi:hypothetical protein